MSGGDTGQHEAELFLGGIVLAILGLVAAFLAVGVGSVRGHLVRGDRHRAEPPERGSVPSERHEHTRSAAAR